MTTKKKQKASRTIIAKARKVLKFAQKRAKEVKYNTELANSLYTKDGMVLVTFPTSQERRAFFKTKEYEEVIKLIISLPRLVLDEVYDVTMLRLPMNGQSKKRR